ncbi:MAG: transporter substrate-binding domain-containing protein [Desulfobacteraceae bacterium]|mgnify:CR=1 FL=1|nr:transporter substrate-binding domain-containing protein [Desulfobacteraceae bacterium]
MRKSTLIYFCLLFLIALFLPTQSNADTKIKVGVYQNKPLLFTDNDGNVKGIFADILNYIAKKEEWEIDYVNDSWIQSYEDLKSGKLDMLGAIAFSERRNQIFDFTYENVLSNWGQIYINKRSGIESILDFEGKKIAVMQNDIYFKGLIELTEQFGIECRFIEAFEYDVVLELVESGKCDAGLVNYLYGHQNERKYHINKTSIILSPQQISFAVPKGKNKALINTIDLHLRKLKGDKSSIYYQSLSKWVGVDTVQINPIWLIILSVGAICLILIFLVLNMILRKQVIKRTQELNAKNQHLIDEIERRKKVEEALKKNEEKYRSVFENTGTATFIIEEDMTISKVNTKAEDMTGYVKAEIEGKLKTTDLVSKKELKRITDYHYARRGNVGEFPSEYTLDIVDKKGNIKKTFIQISVIPGSQRSIASLIDITSRIEAEEALRQNEEKLQQAQKMKAIGTLAGGVAHDLNNILSGIVSYPDLILMDLPNDSPLIGPIQTIRESGKKAAAIVQDLLTLARRGVSVSEVVNLNDLVDEYLISPQFEKLKSYHPNVKVESHLDPALLNVMGSPIHLSKTVMNLVSNAAEAMPEGGSIEIKTTNKYVDFPINGNVDVEEGDYIGLTVSDSGIGIAADDINRIFEPFYTKKVMGRSGTGLGMAVVWGTVEDHNGYIHIESREGKGTTIKLYFPVTRETARRMEMPLSFDNYKGNGQHILVVDDVKEQLEIASKILTQLGYSVETVCSGEKACEYLESNSPDLIMLDMIMAPGIDGLETYKRINSKYPQQRAIIASGYSETERVREAQRLGAGKYVKKPYTIEKIGLAIKSELKTSQNVA